MSDEQEWNEQTHSPPPIHTPGGLPGVAAREAFLKAVLKNHRDVEEIVKKSEGFTIDHLNSLINSVYREKKELSIEIDRLRALFKIPKAEEAKPMGLA